MDTSPENILALDVIKEALPTATTCEQQAVIAHEISKLVASHCIRVALIAEKLELPIEPSVKNNPSIIDIQLGLQKRFIANLRSPQKEPQVKTSIQPESAPVMSDTIFEESGQKLDAVYFTTPHYVKNDLENFAQKLGEGKIIDDLRSRNMQSLEIICLNGEPAKGQRYLRYAAVALGVAANLKEAGSKQPQTLLKLKEIVANVE